MNSIMEVICGVCTNIRTNSKHGIVFQKLLTQIRKEFRKQGFELHIRSLRDKTLNSEEFYVNAYYDAEEDKIREIPIEIVVHHNFNKDLCWDTKHITDFLVQIFDAVVHEFKHQRQSRKRYFKAYWNIVNGKHHYKDYLRDPDEIDAYALSIAIELCRSLGKYRAIRYMPKFISLSRLKFQDRYVSPSLSAYVGQFGTLENRIVRLLAKKVYVRLQKVDTDYIFM